VIIKTELMDLSDQFNYDDYQNALKIITDIVDNNPDVLFIRRDWEGLIFLIKGNTSEYLVEEKDLLLERIGQDIQKTRYQLSIGCGSVKNRIAYIYQSFVEALVDIQNSTNETRAGATITMEKADLLKIDSSAVDDYLRTGVKEDFDNFFNSFIQPLGDNVLSSNYIKNYIFINVVLAVVKFMNELGGDIDQAVLALNSIETTLKDIKTKDQLKNQVSRILESALAFRDNQANRQYTAIIRQAKDFIDQHFDDADLSLSDVAARVNLSPSHFSVVFSHETSQTFKDYLTETRIKKAKEMLRMTNLKAAEISYQVGYNDPHYFSYVFRKNTGLSPTEFRAQTRQ
jgi:two-component system response regulator YesN